MIIILSSYNNNNWTSRIHSCLSGEEETDVKRGQTPAESRLKSRSCFLSSVRPADFHPKVIRCNEWQYRLNTKTHGFSANIIERFAKGHTSEWTICGYINRLRTGVTCSKEQRKTYGYYEGDTTCDCGVSSENTRPMLECLLFAHSCSLMTF